jgi:integrase
VLLRKINRYSRKLKTNKKPLLATNVAAYVRRARKICASRSSSTEAKLRAARDAFALTMSFAFGLRISELLALDGRDIDIVDVDVAGAAARQEAVRITIRSSKNRSSPLDTHDPYRSHSSAGMLLDALDMFNTHVGFPRDDQPVWRRSTGKSADRLGRSWFVTVVKEAAPGCTPHSARVGLATDLRANGCSLDTIMACGRWRSVVALLYILGTVDCEIDTSRRLGSAGLAHDALGLRQMTPPTTDVQKFCIAAGAEDADSDSEDEL